jgi:glucosamine kinase
MILVADSGSSKTDWLLYCPGEPTYEIRSAGLNPYFLNEKEIVKVIQSQCNELVKASGKIKEIYFFGAGCSSPDRREIVSNAISQLFSKAFVSIDSDMLGSAYATCGHQAGLCCVLGTGSNIAFFDGKDIHDGKHGLGYILGDEGSGSYFGKTLITDFLHGKMPANIKEQFNSKFNIDKEIVIQNVYQKANANTYLASFAIFLSDIKGTAYGRKLLHDGLTEFIVGCIKTYPDYHQYKCHFVGSVAYYFAAELNTICQEHNVTVGKIIKKPIHDLLDFINQRNNSSLD